MNLHGARGAKIAPPALMQYPRHVPGSMPASPLGPVVMIMLGKNLVSLPDVCSRSAVIAELTKTCKRTTRPRRGDVKSKASGLGCKTLTLCAVHATELGAPLEVRSLPESKPLCQLHKTGPSRLEVSALALGNWLGWGVIPLGGGATRRGGKNSHNYTIYYG